MSRTWLVCSVAMLLGAGGDMAAPPTGIALTYEGEGLTLDNSTNACLVSTSGAAFSTGSQIPPGESREFLISFGAGEAPQDWSPLGMQGSVVDAELFISGGFDLVDISDGLRQMIAVPAACEVDVSFLETDSAAPFLDIYETAFTCPVVPYIILNRQTGAAAGNGTLSQFSGTYECYMSKFDDGPYAFQRP